MAEQNTVENGAETLELFGYWRSSSSYRVRIALNLKGLEYRYRAVNLLPDAGEQRQESYRAVNPLGLVPALRHGHRTIVQSVAICEYLEEAFPGVALLPADPEGRARVRGLVQSISSEIQPLNNLGVMGYLAEAMHQDQASVQAWYGHWVARGFRAIESWLAAGGLFCHGDRPTLADCFLVPQVYNAERFNCDLEPYPRIRRVTERCLAIPAFEAAVPENQPDAPS